MTRIITSRLGQEYGDRHQLLEAIDVDRRAKLGCIMNDGHGHQHSRDSLVTRRIRFPPIYARTIRNVELSSGFAIRKDDALYPDASLWTVNASRQEHVDRAVRSVLLSSADFAATGQNTMCIPEPVLITNNEGSTTWGHWVVHNLPRIALAKAAFPDLLVMIPDIYFGRYANFGSLLDQLKIPRDHLIPSRAKLLYKLDAAVLVDYLYAGNAIHPFCIDVFRSIAARWQPDAAAPKRRIAIERASRNKREIENRDEAVSCLAAAGFEIETLGARKLTDQISAWTGATSVCSVLGSDLANIVFATPGTSVMALTPSWFGDDLFFDLAAACGLTWHELFCGQLAEKRAPIIDSSFRIDIRALGTFLHAAQ